jgi:tripartite-type tricarboxylate transporter receptor subunit TctC
LRRAWWGCLLAAGCSAALACERSVVSVVVPYPAGGSLDGVMRIVADAASQATQRSFVVRNIGGGAGTIGVQHVLRQPADGCTVLAGNLNTLVLAPAQIASAGYVPHDFQPVGLVGQTDYVVIAAPGLAAERLEDLPALAAQRASALTAGHPGPESVQYLALPMLAHQLQLALLPVPYKGSAPLLKDLAGGHIDLAVVASPAGVAAAAHGRVKLLAHLSQWLASEAGGRAPPLASWAGWFVPRTVPEPASQWLRQALHDALAAPRAARALQALGSPVPALAAQEGFAERFARDAQRFNPRQEQAEDVPAPNAGHGR